MRNSKQRDTILKIVRGSCDHPTAEMVYEKARLEINNISLGTVYRNLNLLSEEGLIKRIKLLGESDRFDKTLENHSHIICEKCGEVSDIMGDNIQEFIDQLESKTDSRITKYEISLRGICSDCQQ